jgi:hypothetical protein
MHDFSKDIKDHYPNTKFHIKRTPFRWEKNDPDILVFSYDKVDTLLQLLPTYSAFLQFTWNGEQKTSQELDFWGSSVKGQIKSPLQVDLVTMNNCDKKSNQQKMFNQIERLFGDFTEQVRSYLPNVKPNRDEKIKLKGCVRFFEPVYDKGNQSKMIFQFLYIAPLGIEGIECKKDLIHLYNSIILVFQDKGFGPNKSKQRDLCNGGFFAIKPCDGIVQKAITKFSLDTLQDLLTKLESIDFTNRREVENVY